MFSLLPELDILGLLSGCGGMSIKRIATENEGPKRRLLGIVYFHLKSNLPSLINDSDEGSDSVPGDGERKKRARALPGLFGTRPEEREPAPVREGRGIPVCTVQGRGAD